MRPFQALFLSLILVLSMSFPISYSYGQATPAPEKKIGLWFVLRLRDYRTDMPISNTSIVATYFTAWGQMRTGPAFTNETGIIQVFLGNFVNITTPTPRPMPATTPTPLSLLELSLSNNYTLIKVNDLFVEDAQYESEYVANLTKYTGIRRISLVQRNVGNQTFMEVNLWVLKGRLIKVLDCDPVTGEGANLLMKPAVKAVVEKQKMGEYEGYYFFPLNYDVIITHATKSNTERTYPPLRAVVGENTTLIDWMYHASNAYVNNETAYMDREVEWLSNSGYSLDREIDEYQAIKNLLKRVLELYEKGEYGPALGGARISAKRLNSLKTWLSNLKTYGILTSIGICLFAYGLSFILSSFVFEEPSENKIRLVIKVLVFSLLMLMFSFTHPSLKITYSIIIEKAIGAATTKIDMLISLLGCFIAGSITYFFITLISIKKMPMTDLALQLGIRSLKRRQSRTILTLITITIIVSSAMIFVNVSASRETRIKESWKGTDTPGVLVKPDIEFAPLSEYDINWTRKQVWCKDLGFREEIRPVEPLDESMIVRTGILMLGEQNLIVNIVGIEPAFMERYYNLSKHVRGFWQDFSPGEPVAILPTSYEVSTGEYVTLAVDEVIEPPGIFLGKRPLGSFRVVGKFDPASLSSMTKIDNNPLFENTPNLVLVPIKAIVDRSMVISEATIKLEEGFDPMDVANELAYSLGVPTIANKGGLAMRIEWSLELSAVGLVPYLVPLVIAGLMVYVTMASVYEERRREFTTLATLGLDPRNTFQVFIVETFLLGLMGTFFGFFGSYILVIVSFYLTYLLGPYSVPTLSLSYANWSMPAILVAFFTGVVMVLLGGYIPAAKAQGLSLMGRVKRRQLIGELISDKNITRFTLPIKETIQNSEMLYTYIRENIGKIKSSLVDPHSIKGEIRGDGSFTVSFVAYGSGQTVFVPCEIKGMREGESLTPLIEFPTGYKDYGQIRDILRDLEEYMIGFSAWKEMQLKMKIVRETPRKQKTLEEVLTEIRDVIGQIKDGNKKLKILEAQKSQLSEEVYNEFRQKYGNMIEEKSKGLRSMAIGLEPYSNQLREEIKKLEVDIERITISYNLGEISEEEYVKTCGPLQGKIATVKGKVNELEEIFEFLKKPLGII